MKKILPLLFLAFFNVQTASALDCDPGTVEENIERASIIFSGTLVKRVELGAPVVLFGYYSQQSAENTFEVSEIYKGNESKTVTVKSSDMFIEGEDYLVYAKGEENDFATIFCGPTKLLADAEEDLEKLNAQGDELTLKIMVIIGALVAALVFFISRKPLNKAAK